MFTSDRAAEHRSWLRVGRQSEGRKREKYPGGLTQRRGGGKPAATVRITPLAGKRENKRRSADISPSGEDEVTARKRRKSACVGSWTRGRKRDSTGPGRIFRCCRVNFAVDAVLKRRRKEPNFTRKKRLNSPPSNPPCGFEPATHSAHRIPTRRRSVALCRCQRQTAGCSIMAGS